MTPARFLARPRNLRPLPKYRQVYLATGRRKEATGTAQPAPLPSSGSAPPTCPSPGGGAEHCTLVSLVATAPTQTFSAPAGLPRLASCTLCCPPPPRLPLPARRKGTPFLPRIKHFSCPERGSPYPHAPNATPHLPSDFDRVGPVSLVLRPLPFGHGRVPIDPALVHEEILVHLQDGCGQGERGWGRCGGPSSRVPPGWRIRAPGTQGIARAEGRRQPDPPPGDVTRTRRRIKKN